MNNKILEHSDACEPFYLKLGDKNVVDIVITNHARNRWIDRVESEKTGFEDISTFLWDKLKTNQIEPYYRKEQDVYLVDDDLVVVAEFSEVEKNMAKPVFHKMIIVTFLGRMSETMELRDLKSYYSWLRHSRRMTLMKNNRKKR